MLSLQKVIRCLQDGSRDGRTPLSITRLGWSHIMRSIHEGWQCSRKWVGSMIIWERPSSENSISNWVPSLLLSLSHHQFIEWALKSPVNTVQWGFCVSIEITSEHSAVRFLCEHWNHQWTQCSKVSVWALKSPVNTLQWGFCAVSIEITSEHSAVRFLCEHWNHQWTQCSKVSVSIEITSEHNALRFLCEHWNRQWTQCSKVSVWALKSPVNTVH